MGASNLWAERERYFQNQGKLINVPYDDLHKEQPLLWSSPRFYCLKRSKSSAVALGIQSQNGNTVQLKKCQGKLKTTLDNDNQLTKDKFIEKHIFDRI